MKRDMNYKLLTILVISLFWLAPVYSAPRIGNMYMATVIHVAEPNILVVENLYTHHLDTVVICGTRLSSNAVINYHGRLFVEHECLGDFITVAPYGHDKYNRIVANIRTSKFRWLSYELIAQGYAYWYPQFDPNDSVSQECEKWAKRHKSGVWRYAI